jgi:hypothetical protein
MSASTPPGQYLSSTIARRGKALLNQQCWLWGQDIKRIEGNLLLVHGFERLRPPDGLSGSSQYTLSLPGNLNVRLWGFGIYFGAESGIFLNRFEFIPREARMADLWQAREMTGLPRARNLSLLVQILRWIGAYEAWVLRTLGVEYRKSCLCGWQGGNGTRPDLIPKAWNELALLVERSSSHHQPVSGTAGCHASGSKERLTYSSRIRRRERTHDPLRENRAAASA